MRAVSLAFAVVCIAVLGAIGLAPLILDSQDVRTIPSTLVVPTPGPSQPGLSPAGPPAIPTATPYPRVTQTLSASELGVWLDPTGRPYELAPRPPTRRRWEMIEARFVPGGGDLLYGDGRTLILAPSALVGRGAMVDFGEAEELEITVLWESVPVAGESTETAIGFRLDVPGTQVALWGSSELALGTDDGGAGVISTAVEGFEIEDRLTMETWETSRPLLVMDTDGDGSADLLVVDTGVLGGGLHLSRGYDDTGLLVAAYVFDQRVPWRLSGLEGTPPPSVTTREDDLAACLAGEREVEVRPDGLVCALGR